MVSFIWQTCTPCYFFAIFEFGQNLTRNFSAILGLFSLYFEKFHLVTLLPYYLGRRSLQAGLLAELCHGRCIHLWYLDPHSRLSVYITCRNICFSFLIVQLIKSEFKTDSGWCSGWMTRCDQVQLFEVILNHLLNTECPYLQYRVPRLNRSVEFSTIFWHMCSSYGKSK